MARDTQTGVFDSCLAALPLQKPKTEQILTECASVDGHCRRALGNLSSCNSATGWNKVACSSSGLLDLLCGAGNLGGTWPAC